MKTLEVRCCCEPERLIGFLTVPDDVVEVGHRYRREIVKVEKGVDWGQYSKSQFTSTVLEFEVALLNSSHGGTRLALKCEHIDESLLGHLTNFRYAESADILKDYVVAERSRLGLHLSGSS